MGKTLADVKGINIDDKVAITINFTEGKSTTISGTLAGIQTLPTSGQVGLCVRGLVGWIWIEDNMVVTWVSEDN